MRNIIKIPSEYYFHVQDSSKYSKGQHSIYADLGIVKISYWNEYHHLDDNHLGISGVLPNGISEESESVFSSPYSVEETRALMLELGFQEDEKFSQFINNHNITNEID